LYIAAAAAAAVCSVLLATEPASVLFPVITSALQIDYPQHKLKILVLDDGARDFVEDYVIELQTMLYEAGNGCTLDYIARIKPAQHWAKAGNINHAFIERKLQGDFVLIIDADMVVAPQILQRMLPAFYDQVTVDTPDTLVLPSHTSTASILPSTTTTTTTTKTSRWTANKVGWVQSPQTFSNIKWGDPLDLAQTMWYSIGIVGRDAIAAVPFCGKFTLCLDKRVHVARCCHIIH
jgi:cellulose synthase/poly-beta-1,6-N-acetylglucosamine synthase-like glycosyltransferase